MISITSTVAKTDDGTVQITFSIPQSLIDHEEVHVLEELQKTLTLPGFRKGKAPLDKVKKATAKEKLLEKTLMRVLPSAFADAVKEYNLTPAVYPKFEIVSQDNPWQIRATTCEIAPFEIGDYKKLAKEALTDTKLWTPDQGDPKDIKEPTTEEKQYKVLQALLDSVSVTIPKILIEEETNARLAQLIEKIEKLGLTLDGYLASISKDPQSIRNEYEKQTTDSIKMELILNKIAELEKITISPDTVDKAIATSGVPSKEKGDDYRRRIVTSVLRRRAVLDALVR
jgi:FKBP-type peptidyl-prolyl cis-trans isomerase (trigger factor)